MATTLEKWHARNWFLHLFMLLLISALLVHEVCCPAACMFPISSVVGLLLCHWKPSCHQ